MRPLCLIRLLLLLLVCLLPLLPSLRRALRAVPFLFGHTHAYARQLSPRLALSHLSRRLSHSLASHPPRSTRCRPSFQELTPQLQLLLDMVREDEARKAASASASSSKGGGLLSKLNLRSKESSREGGR